MCRSERFACTLYGVAIDVREQKSPTLFSDAFRRRVADPRRRPRYQNDFVLKSQHVSTSSINQ
jgi:hypothetical protein